MESKNVIFQTNRSYQDFLQDINLDPHTLEFLKNFNVLNS
jgi:hypothetical protein